MTRYEMEDTVRLSKLIATRTRVANRRAEYEDYADWAYEMGRLEYIIDTLYDKLGIEQDNRIYRYKGEA